MSTAGGKYRLAERIGGGGMAEVFRATLVGVEGFSRPVAIKRMLPTLSADPAFADMFVNEARLASLLAHPNVVSVVDFDRDAQGRLFLVMELVEGKDLRALVDAGSVPVPIAAYAIAEVLRALAYAHDLVHQGRPLGLVHRDVSPHNVLLSWGGAVKLSDFGIAKAMAASGASRTGNLKGKVGYMSPEQAHGLHLDGRSDLFAVGVMFHELLVGQRLFGGVTEAEVLSRMLAQPIPPPAARNAAVSADLEAVCLGLLERDRDRRFASASAALEALLSTGAVSARGQIELAALMRARFPGMAGGRDAAAAFDATAALAGVEPGRAAAMAAPTRTQHPPRVGPASGTPERLAPGATQTAPATAVAGTPTAAGERPGGTTTESASPRRWKWPVAFAAAALFGAAVVAVSMLWGDRDPAPSSLSAAHQPRSPSPLAPPSDAAPALAATTDEGAADRSEEARVEPSKPAPAEPTVPGDGRRRSPAAPSRDRDAPDPASLPPARALPPEDTPRQPRSRRERREPGMLFIYVDPWAQVIVDGEPRGATPVRLRLAPGLHTVVLHNEERNQRETLQVDVPAGGEKTLRRNW